VLLLLIPSVSYGQKKPEWKGTIEEEGGILVIKNPKKPIHSEDVFQLEEDLFITSPDEEELLFQHLTYLDVDEAENIYVADTKAGNILVFDKKGKFLRKIGKRGQGPGEMRCPFEVLILGNEELFINDRGQAKAHFITLEGEFLR
jgi:hypothetical protein